MCKQRFNTCISFSVNREGSDTKIELPSVPSLRDEITHLPVVKVSAKKVKGLDLILGKGNELRVSITMIQI